MPIGEQEKALRQNPLGAGSDLLKKYLAPVDPSYFSTLVFSCGFRCFPVLSGSAFLKVAGPRAVNESGGLP